MRSLVVRRPPSPRARDDVLAARFMEDLYAQETSGAAFTLVSIVHEPALNAWAAVKEPGKAEVAYWRNKDRFEAWKDVGDPVVLTETQLVVALEAVPQHARAAMQALFLVAMRRLVRARRSYYVVRQDMECVPVESKPHLMDQLARWVFGPRTKLMRLYRLVVNPQLRSLQREREDMMRDLLQRPMPGAHSGTAHSRQASAASTSAISSHGRRPSSSGPHPSSSMTVVSAPPSPAPVPMDIVRGPAREMQVAKQQELWAPGTGMEEASQWPTPEDAYSSSDYDSDTDH